MLTEAQGLRRSLRRNIDVLARIRLTPCVCGGTAGQVAMSMTFFGIPLALPVMLAPVGPLELSESEGSLQSA